MSIVLYTPSDLATVINTDPGVLGVSPTKGDLDNSKSLCALSASYTVYGQVSPNKLLQWAGSPSAGVSGGSAANNTPLQAINAYISSTGAEPRMVGICQAALQIFNLAAPFDLTDPNNFNPAYPGAGQSPGLLQILAGVNNFGAAGAAIQVISTGQQNALVSLGAKNPAAWSETRWGLGVLPTADDIRRAMGRG